jgi:hypothetical protein
MNTFFKILCFLFCLPLMGWGQEIKTTIVGTGPKTVGGAIRYEFIPDFDCATAIQFWDTINNKMIKRVDLLKDAPYYKLPYPILSQPNPKIGQFGIEHNLLDVPENEIIKTFKLDELKGFNPKVHSPQKARLSFSTSTPQNTEGQVWNTKHISVLYIYRISLSQAVAAYSFIRVYNAKGEVVYEEEQPFYISSYDITDDGRILTYGYGDVQDPDGSKQLFPEMNMRIIDMHKKSIILDMGKERESGNTEIQVGYPGVLQSKSINWIAGRKEDFTLYVVFIPETNSFYKKWITRSGPYKMPKSQYVEYSDGRREYYERDWEQHIFKTAVLPTNTVPKKK